MQYLECITLTTAINTCLLGSLILNMTKEEGRKCTQNWIISFMKEHGLRTPRESFFSKIPKPHSKLCQTQFLRIRSSIEIQDTHSQQKSHFQKIFRPHQNLICSCNFLQPNHGLRTPRESFFSKIPKPHSKLCQT